MTEFVDQVMASYHRCRLDDQFFDTFYDLFLSKSTEVRLKFIHTDFTHQKLMLRESLLEMLCFESGVEGARKGIEQLGRRHQELDIKPEMYQMWLDALCEAVKMHDPEYTADLELRWRQALQSVIDVMLSVDDTPNRVD